MNEEPARDSGERGTEPGAAGLPAESRGLANRAFGADSRARMLEEYFAATEEVTPANAWAHVYGLLLWIDPTTGLAHCYESDKAQPGRPWYERSLAFHDWVSSKLATAPATLGERIDWLFKRGTQLLAATIARQGEARDARVGKQREPYAGKGMPQPGEDPAMEMIVREELAPWLAQPPPPEGLRRLTRRIRTYLMQENKRKNLVGEGFEDVLASVIRRLPGAGALEVRTRSLLSQLPGFREPPTVEKEKRPDVAILGPGDRRILVSAKWSVRADREEQFAADFEAYARLESWGKDFSFVLVTNEFDAARIEAACERRRQNANLFSAVVHVNPEGVLAAYGSAGRGAALRVSGHRSRGRLISLEEWLASLLPKGAGSSSAPV
jgi:hypothetical protein